MFGSTNPFGQSSSSPFGSQSVFGQTSNASSNPFAPKPFGTSSPFNAQTGGSIFGGTSTGVFGAPQSSSPFSSTTTFGASSSPAFGSSTPSFGASSTPAFGSSSSPFGGSSVFGQKPAFGFSTPQSSPFGSTTPQSQPAFGSSIFGASTPFGATSTPAFGATSSPAFGASSTPAFGASSMPAFGASSIPAFGASSTPAFGASSTPAFGATSTPSFGGTAFGSGSAFGAPSTPSFGASSTPAFGASSSPAFGASSTPAFGASSTSAFGASSTPSFSFGSAPAFGQSASAFGSSAFGSTPSSFGAQSSPFGAQASTPTFGGSGFSQSAFGGQQGGSRVAPYTPTTEAETGTGTQPAGKLESICAMPVYRDKSHEELRWEDYQRGDKGGPQPAGQSPGGTGFGVTTSQANPFASSSAFGQTSSNPFSSSTPANPFAPQTPTFSSSGFGMATSTFGSSPFATTSSSNPFGSTSSTTTSLFGSSSAFGSSTSSSLFGSSSTPAFASSPSIFGSTPAQGTTPAFGSSLNFASSQAPSLFSSTPSGGQTGSAFGQTGSAFGTFGQSSTPAFGQTSLFSTPSAGFGSLFSSSSSLTTSTSSPFGATPSAVMPFQPAQPAQTSASFPFGGFGQTQLATAAGVGGGSGIFSQGNFGQPSASQSSVILQPVAVTNPFGALPAMPQISIAQAGPAPTIQYGISNMPVVDKPAPVRFSSLLTSRHLLQRRVRLPARKYRPGDDGPKVPFFSDDEETSNTPKADALLIPRENPRALVIRPVEQWSSRAKSAPPKDSPAPVHENGKSSQGDIDAGNKEDNVGENGSAGERVHPVKANQKLNGTHVDHALRKDGAYQTLSGHRAGEAAIVYEHGADIEALMPKLRRSDYYTEPRIQELAAKERAQTGYCKGVKDFVVGRHGYGSIKFLGETDVRRLDLETLVQFNNREVIVYMDESKKPPVGQGLNKPAEVTLLNIKCFDKKSGKQYTEGAKVEKYKEMLRRKAEEQGAEFVSYDAVKGEWKFKVDHFSCYKLQQEEDEDNEEENR